MSEVMSLSACWCQDFCVCERFSLTGAFSLKLSFLVGITESEFLLFLPLAVRWDVHFCLTWWLWIKRLFCLTAFMVCELQDYSWDNLSIFYICSFCHGGLKPQTVFSPSKLSVPYVRRTRQSCRIWFSALSHKCWIQSPPCPHLQVNDLVNEVVKPPKTLDDWCSPSLRYLFQAFFAAVSQYLNFCVLFDIKRIINTVSRRPAFVLVIMVWTNITGFSGHCSASFNEW